MTTMMVEDRAGGWLPPGGGSSAHPVAACVAAVEVALDAVGEACCWALADAEVADLVRRAHTVQARLEAVRLRLVAEADRRRAGAGVGTGAAATSTTAWLAAEQLVSGREAGAAVRLAAELGGRCAQTGAALAAGLVNAEQAGVIVTALRRLPASLGAAQREAAEGWLVEQARTFGPDQLRVLGRRVWEVIDPAGADAAEGEALQDEEARARAKARMWMRPVGDGTTRGGFVLPDAQAEMLRAALDALLSPRRPTATPAASAGPAPEPPVSDAQAPDDIAPDDSAPDTMAPDDSAPDDPALADVAAATDVGGQGDTGVRFGPVDPDLDQSRLPYEQRRGLAMCELIEHLPMDKLPQSGRSTPSVVVSIDHQALLDAVGSATLSTGGRVSAGQARRLACNAGVLPMVLGGDSAVLDLGRERRFFDHHQRIAMGAGQGGCVADGCERPPAWCEGHHVRAWSSHGRTDLDNGVLLCGWHHHLVHQPGWDVAFAPDGVPELIPPAVVDPARRPIRHRRFGRRRPPT